MRHPILAVIFFILLFPAGLKAIESGTFPPGIVVNKNDITSYMTARKGLTASIRELGAQAATLRQAYSPKEADLCRKTIGTLKLHAETLLQITGKGDNGKAVSILSSMLSEIRQLETQAKTLSTTVDMTGASKKIRNHEEQLGLLEPIMTR